MPLHFVDLRVNQVGIIENPLSGRRERVIQTGGLHQIVPGGVQRELVLPQPGEYRAAR